MPPTTTDRRKPWRRETLRALGVKRADDGAYVIPTSGGELRYYDDGRRDKTIAAHGSTRELWPNPGHVFGDDLLVVEGEPDAITAWQLDMPTVALPGAGKVGDDWPQRLAQYRRRVTFLADSDDVGRARMRAMAAKVADLGVEARVIEAAPDRDDGFDLSDLVLDVGEDAARQAIEDAIAFAPPVVPERAKVSTIVDTGGHPATSVEVIRAAVLDASVDTLAGADEPREEVPGTEGLLWRGLPQTVFGDRGEGKSIATLIVTLAAAASGERVLYLDRENGPSQTKSLVRGILDAHDDWPDVLGDGRWTGRHWPTFDHAWQPGDYAEAIAGRGYTGVVYDSVREVISQLGGDPNSDADVSALIGLLVTPLLQRGVWVVLLDNVGHDDKSRPKNSGTKADAVSTLYQIRTVAEFSPTKLGEVALKCTRSRYGDMGREWSAAIGAGKFDVPEARSESPGEQAARTERERFEAYAHKVMAALADGPLGRDPLEAIGGARKTTLRAWLARMVASDEWPIEHDKRLGYCLVRGGPDGGGPGPIERPGHPGPNRADQG